jgi:hypothetical protein
MFMNSASALVLLQDVSKNYFEKVARVIQGSDGQTCMVVNGMKGALA